MRSHAVLTIESDPYIVSLEMFGAELNEPNPEHHLLAQNYSYYSYYGLVGVRSTRAWNGPAFEIKTMTSTGRGQTAMFDKLVGPEIATARLELGRKINRDSNTGIRVGGRSVIDIHLSEEDVMELAVRVQTCADDEPEPTFFVYGEEGLSRFDSSNKLVWGRG